MRFSIIIPAYNAERTLPRCLDSVLDQTFDDSQILIVDDGSTDGTAAAAAQYAARDSRIRLIRTARMGSGAARNRGLEQAEGEYVLYLDADDHWLRGDLLERLDRQIRAHGPDTLMFQMVKTRSNGDVLERCAKPRFRQENMMLELKDVYADLVRDGQTLASACNKCVRRELMVRRGIRFREDVLGEDIDWVLRLFSHVQTICLMNLNAYAYTQHKGESRSSHPDAPNDLICIVADWAARLDREELCHRSAVAGLAAFEYGICMGSFHRMSAAAKGTMRAHTWLLAYGLDRKTAMISRFERIFGFRLTCLAIRLYLWLRKRSIT